jgi:hypothetical protein
MKGVRIVTTKSKWYHWVMVVAVFCVLDTPGHAYNTEGGRPHDTVPKFSASYTSCQEFQNFNFDEFTENKRFHLNTLCTTPYQNPDTPAWADIIKAPENFVECNGATIALCYYSGPVTPANAVGEISVPATPCVLRPGEDIADCTCIEIPAGMPYLVDINAILNLDVYLDTVNECGLSGRNCLPAGTKEAPVCKAIREGKLIPGADLISTFSFALEREIPIVQGECTDENYLYAGCMTAPCKRTGTYDPDSAFPLVQCACPTFTGPFQVGRSITSNTPCDLRQVPSQDNTVWSAAYTDIDPQAACDPDRPGDDGCPILPPNYKETVTIPYDVDCRKVCSEYKQSNQNGIQVGFTCDATLCTDPSNRALWAEACKGLGKHSTSEILKLEYEVGYSCAASQICGCEPNKKTNEEIWRLNEAQKKLDPDVVTQCEYNGTLCGTEPL